MFSEKGVTQPSCKKKGRTAGLRGNLSTLTTSRISAFVCLGNLGQKLSSQITGEAVTTYKHTKTSLLGNSVHTGPARYVVQHTDQKSREYGGASSGQVRSQNKNNLSLTLGNNYSTVVRGCEISWNVMILRFACCRTDNVCLLFLYFSIFLQ